MNKKRTKLKKEEYDLIQSFTAKLIEKLERGRSTYGEDYKKLSEKQVKKEIEMELLDISGWAILFWMKLKKEGKL